MRVLFHEEFFKGEAVPNFIINGLLQVDPKVHLDLFYGPSLFHLVHVIDQVDLPSFIIDMILANPGIDKIREFSKLVGLFFIVNILIEFSIKYASYRINDFIINLDINLFKNILGNLDIIPLVASWYLGTLLY